MKRIKPSNILLVLVVFISIGFAYLSTNLAINGTSLFKKSSWDVHFDNIEIDSGSVQLQTGDYAPTISNDGLTVSYKITCNIPGEYYKFNIDVVNDGSLNAKIDSINAPTIPQGYEDNILFSLKYLDGTDVKEGNVLLAGEKTTYVVTTKNRDDISADQLISEAVTLPMEVSISYTQIKSSDITTATFKTGWEVSTLMASLSEKIRNQVFFSENGNSIKYFLRSETLDDDTNIISTEDSDSPIYMWYEPTEELYDDYQGIYYGIIYWYTEADVVYLNEDSSFFFNHLCYEHGYHLDENYEATEEEQNSDLAFASLMDISGVAQINTSKVENMYFMFNRCYALNDHSPLKTWHVNNVTDMGNMFEFNKSMQNVDFLSKWNISNVTNMTYMFSWCNEVSNLLPFENWNVSKSTDMSYMFYCCNEITNLTPLENWNVSHVTNMESMFYSSKINNLGGLENWNVSNVTKISGMFYGCTYLTDITALTNWNVSNVTTMGHLFSYCSGITNLDALSTWRTDIVNDMNYMFCRCESLTNISGLRNWNVSNVTNMSCMFSGCSGLTDLSPLSNWNTSSLTRMDSMFSGCSILSNATSLENWNVSNVVNMRSMFDNTATTASTRPSWYS